MSTTSSSVPLRACRSCRRKYASTEAVCPHCGARPSDTRACVECGTQVAAGRFECPTCGTRMAPPPAVPAFVPREMPAVWPSVVVTVLFSVLGIIPAAIGASGAQRNGGSGTPYWMAFLITLGAMLLLGLVMYWFRQTY